jgi:hypothetical protein
MIAQIIRAVLLAIATVASRKHFSLSQMAGAAAQ